MHRSYHPTCFSRIPARVLAGFLACTLLVSNLVALPALAVTTPGTLTLSGNEMTDASRTAAIQGDGRTPPDSSVGIWEATTNLITNGGFETGVTNWTPVGATITSSTEQAKFGTKSGKLVAAGADGYAAAFVIGVAQTTYTESVWVYAPAGYVGKTVRLQMTEVGGAQAAGLMGFNDTALIAGWQRLALSASVAQPDRAYVAFYVNMHTAAANDTIYIDGMHVEQKAYTTPYVETNGVTASRTAARVQVPIPAGAMSGVQGWIAARLRTNWNSTTPPGTPRLWRWYDNANNLIEVRYENGLWKLRRTTAAGTEEATFPNAFSAGALTTIVAAWTANGPMLSVNGAAFHAPIFWDDFERANTAGGTLGTSPNGSPWILTGTGYQNARISSGRYILDPGLTSYAYNPLPSNPVRLSAKFSLTSTEDAAGIGLLASKAPLLGTMVHLAIARTITYVQITNSGGPGLVTLATITYPALAADGTVYNVGITYNADNTVDVETPDGKITHVGPDSRFGSYLGNDATWELFPGNGQNTNTNWRFESVNAEAITDSPHTGIGGATTIAATSADIGSSGGTADFLDGDILWFAGGKGTLTSADAATINGFGSTDPSFGSFAAANSATILWTADTASYTASDGTDGTQATAGATGTGASVSTPSSGAANPNCLTGWAYCIMAGAKMIGLTGFLNGGDASGALTYIGKEAHHFDTYITIRKRTPAELLAAVPKPIPFPWSQGLNTAGEIYEYRAYSAFNGFPVPAFDHPVTVVLPYDATKAKAIAPRALQIAAYNAATKRWQILPAAPVLNMQNHTIAATTRVFTYFVAAYAAQH